MGRVIGKIRLSELPGNRGLILYLGFYRTTITDGRPSPASELAHLFKINEYVHVEREQYSTSYESAYEVDLENGSFFGEARVIMLRLRNGQLWAQTEQFLNDHPIPVVPGGESRENFEVDWPAKRIEDLNYYGTVTPE